MRFSAALLFVLLITASVARAEVAPAKLQTVELVPAVRRGHSVVWKTGAAITVASVGVSLLGAALAVKGVQDDYGAGGNSAMFWSGIAISIAGDGGLAIAGPIVWTAGIGRPAD